ncbi:hypothetical protein KUH32_14475 [Thalassococcus sp. CAU 1522]|uniref:Uncharacterized protein n=1 Tax=Thalassococcus arenae TaxID=2851652 RepID=A0ABS6NBL7_9RHOB|nr:hypothetical protein [Thalassococcus arenae]MBV2360969.1 hypothetical protein [Thalassococcus arenae]
MRLSLFPLLMLATPVLASGPGEKHHGTAFLEGGALTYEVFETTIEHVDLETCPEQFDPDAVFCRMTLAADMAHVFAFAHDGDQTLLAVKSYELADGFLPF